MALQLIEAYIPQKHFAKIHERIKQFEMVNCWFEDDTSERRLVRILLKTKDSEDVLNYFERVASLIEDFEVLLFPVQTYITREYPEEEEDKELDEDDQLELKRASRQELYMQIESSGKSDLTYLIFIFLSTLVIDIGLVKNSASAVIGGMVISPLLGPIIALGFSSILGDHKLLLHALSTVIKGILLSLFIAIVLSILLHSPLENKQFLSRTQVGLSDIVLALAAGAAGALSILRQIGSSLVGVMVAATLLPSTVVLGISIGTMTWSWAIGALLLLLVNITSILLAAAITFLLSGISPAKYEEIQRANNSKKLSTFFIGVIVFLLVMAVVVYRKNYLP